MKALGLIVVFAFLLLPLLFVVVGSFGEATFAFPPRMLSLHWYRGIPVSFWDAFVVSLVVAAASTAAALPLGVMASLGLARGHFRGQQVVNTVLRSPLMLPMLVLGAAIYQYFAAVGRLTGLALGGGLLGLILGHTSFTTAYVTWITLPAVLGLNPTLEEAAFNLGASPWTTFWRVTFPAIRSGVVAGAAFAFLNSFDNFPLSLFLASGPSTTLPIAIFTSIQFDLNPQVLAVSSLLIGLSALAATLLERTIGLGTLMGLKDAR